MRLFYFAPFALATVACQPTETFNISDTTHSQNDSSVAIFTDSLIQPKPEPQIEKEQLTVSSHEEDLVGKEHDQMELAEIKANFKQINSIDYWDSAKHKAFEKASTISNATFYYQEKALKKSSGTKPFTIYGAIGGVLHFR